MALRYSLALFPLALVCLCLVMEGEATLSRLVAEEGQVGELPLSNLGELEKTPVPATAIMVPGDVQPPLNEAEEKEKLEDELLEDAIHRLEEQEIGVNEVEEVVPTVREDQVIEGSAGMPDLALNATEGDAEDVDGEGEQKEPQKLPRIPYSKPKLNKEYKAKDTFNPRGMEHLYLITNLFLQLVHREVEMPPPISKYIS